MLFLAIFCGFLAEWQLEHSIENQREKQLIYSLAEDLKRDTLELINRIKRIGRDGMNNNCFVLIKLVYLTKIISYVYRNEFNRIYKTISK